MILKLGSKGNEVKALQELLELKADGDFGPNTEKAVIAWQKLNHLSADGIVGPNTWAAMQLATTDGAETVGNDVNFDDIIAYLPKGEFIKGPYDKHWMFLHHTAGWENPFKTVTNWANDSRGPVATEFVIGGQSIKGTASKYDGTLVKCFPDKAMGWHLGTGNHPMHRESVGVELCNFGQLTKGGYYKRAAGKKTFITFDPDEYYTYVGGRVEKEQVVILDKEFRGYKAWHRYSDKQVSTLKELIQDVAERDNIDMKKGLQEMIISKGAHIAFDFCDLQYVRNHPGMWTHANVRKGKVDLFPQPEIVDMILSL